MPAYDSALFDPPATVTEVTLRNPKTGSALSGVLMLLDSGADVTLLPRASTDQLNIDVIPDESYELVGFDGQTSFAPVVRLELTFLGRTFRGRFLLTGQQQGILGRDILNFVSLLLDGPHLVWREGRSK